MELAYAYIITILVAAIVGTYAYDLRARTQPAPLVPVLFTDCMTLETAQVVAGIFGWRIIKRGCELHFVGTDRRLRFQAELIGA